MNIYFKVSISCSGTLKPLSTAACPCEIEWVGVVGCVDGGWGVGSGGSGWGWGGKVIEREDSNG